MSKVSKNNSGIVNNSVTEALILTANKPSKMIKIKYSNNR